MAEIHDGLAGHRQIFFRDRVKLAVNLLHQAGAAQHDHLLGGGVRAAPDEPRQFDGHARLAFGQFFENNLHRARQPVAKWFCGEFSRSLPG